MGGTTQSCCGLGTLEGPLRATEASGLGRPPTITSQSPCGVQPPSLSPSSPEALSSGRRSQRQADLRGASSTPGKGHEVGGLAYAKAGSSLRSLPGNSRAIYPQNQSLPTFCFVLSPTPLTLRGAVPHYLSEKRVSLQLQLIIPGCDSVSTYKLLWKSSSLPE